MGGIHKDVQNVFRSPVLRASATGATILSDKEYTLLYQIRWHTYFHVFFTFIITKVAYFYILKLCIFKFIRIPFSTYTKPFTLGDYICIIWLN